MLLAGNAPRPAGFLGEVTSKRNCRVQVPVRLRGGGLRYITSLFKNVGPQHVELDNFSPSAPS